jgi:tetratricopeptide (TPR) repeat protein
VTASPIAALILFTGCVAGVSMNVPPLPLDLFAPVPENLETEAAQEAFANLEPAYARAASLYESRDYTAAAETFMAAARAARGTPESTTWKQMATNRASCYRNAARAWYMAGQFEEKRPLLEQAAREDPLCAADIREILDILG